MAACASSGGTGAAPRHVTSPHSSHPRCHRTGPGGQAAGSPGAAAPTGAATPWRASNALSGPGFPEITAVTATSPTSAWAFTSNGDRAVRPTALTLRGSTWTPIAFPGRSGELVEVARSAAADDVWAFTSANRAIHWDGCSWAVVQGFPARDISGAAVIAANNVWVFCGRPGSGTVGHGSWHYDGRAWTLVPQARGLADASAASASDIWAYGPVGTASATVIAHWNGTTWQRFSVAALLPRPTMYCGPAVNGIYGASGSGAWAVGSDVCQDVPGPSVLLHYADGSWRRVASLGAHVPLAVLPDGRGGVWIPVDGVQILNGEILHYARGVVTSARLPIRPGQLLLFDAAAAPGGGTAFAVGRRTLRPSLRTTAVVLSFQG